MKSLFGLLIGLMALMATNAQALQCSKTVEIPEKLIIITCPDIQPGADLKKDEKELLEQIAQIKKDNNVQQAYMVFYEQGKKQGEGAIALAQDSNYDEKPQFLAAKNDEQADFRVSGH